MGASMEKVEYEYKEICLSILNLISKKGLLCWEDGTRYEGEFKNGLRSGQGK